MMEYLKNVFYGILMGIANVIPGVSGGTMAIILNFYDRLMESITFNWKVLKKNLSFLIFLGIGVVIGILGLSKVMKYLLETFPCQTYMAFFGIILGSLPLIFFNACKSQKKIQRLSWVAMALTLGIMIVLAFAGDHAGGELIKYQSFSLEAALACFGAMIVGASTMIIPGISGSMMLLIMGMYGTIYGFVIPELYIPLLIPAGLGAVVGIFGGAKIITVLLNKFPQITYFGIAGLLIGSLLDIFLRSQLLGNDLLTIVTALLYAAVMFVIIYFFSKYEINKDRKELEQ